MHERSVHLARLKLLCCTSQDAITVQANCNFILVLAEVFLGNFAYKLA